jgi:hypothetical protein
MAKKRGGIAGFYDRNKKIIKPVATGLAGMFGTPALGAAVGAAFGGLDRPGKGGIGLDVMGAAKGGLSGYAAGSAGQSLGKMAGIGKIGGLQSAGSKLGGMFTGGGVPGMAANKLPSMPDGLTSVYDTQNRSSGLGNLGSLFGKDGLIEQNKTLLTGLGKGVMGVRQSALDAEEADRKMAEDARQFNEMQALRMRQQSNLDQDAMMTKQQYDELNANRARLRAILTGGQ